MSTPRRPSMQTQVTERLGIAMPVLAFSHSADVVVSVSRAGGIGNHTYTAKDTEPLLDVCLASGITLFANALGVAPTETVDAFHERGMLVAGLAGTARHGQQHRQAGTDIVISQGYEAGGHTGEIGSMALIPDVVDAAEGTPVLAAGGIASGRQMAAAMMLGAEGVWTGSGLADHRGGGDAPGRQGEVRRRRGRRHGPLPRLHRPPRPPAPLRSGWSEAWEDAEVEPLGMPHQGILYAEAQVRIARGAEQDAGRPRELATYFVGQGVGLMDRVRPARQVVEQMVTDYLAVAERFAAQLQD
jgi:NAD(P)H-dependent flavin oxidoreductase YrpB (nitropropane dioxygenase family)